MAFGNDFRNHATDGRQRSAVRRASRTATNKVLGDGLVRESFTLPTKEARKKAKALLDAYPAAAYWTRVESWQKLPDDQISFTMVRLPTAD